MMPIFQGRKSTFRRDLDILTGEAIPLQYIRRRLQGKQRKMINQQNKFLAGSIQGKGRNCQVLRWAKSAENTKTVQNQRKKSADASFKRREPRCDYKTISVSLLLFYFYCRKITIIVHWAEFGPSLMQKWTRGSIAFCKKCRKLLKGKHLTFFHLLQGKINWFINGENLAMHTLKMSLGNKVSNHQKKHDCRTSPLSKY